MLSTLLVDRNPNWLHRPYWESSTQKSDKSTIIFPARIWNPGTASRLGFLKLGCGRYSSVEPKLCNRNRDETGQEVKASEKSCYKMLSACDDADDCQRLQKDCLWRPGRWRRELCLSVSQFHETSTATGIETLAPITSSHESHCLTEETTPIKSTSLPFEKNKQRNQKVGQWMLQHVHPIHMVFRCATCMLAQWCHVELLKFLQG